MGLDVADRGHGRRPRTVVDQRDLAEIGAGAEGGALLAVRGDLRAPRLDQEEADAVLALFGHDLAGGEIAFLEQRRDLLRLLVVEAGEELRLFQQLGVE